MKSIDKINMFLLQKGISGAELSANAGLSNSAYSQWNTGKTVPSKKTLAKVAAALDVDITELMDDDDLQAPYAYQAMQKAKAELAKEKQKKPVPTEGDGLCDREKLVLSLFNRLPAAHQEGVIAQLQGLVQFQEAQDNRSKFE